MATTTTTTTTTTIVRCPHNNNSESSALLSSSPPRLVQTLAEAKAACARLEQCRIIALDMELSQQRTSLLQLAASRDEVFVFDLLAFEAAQQHHELFDAMHLLPILTDRTILKLVYDGRADAAALFQHHGVAIQGLYDLQVVFTSLWQARDDPFLKGLQHALHCAGISPYALRAFARRKRAFRHLWRTAGTECVLRRPLDQDLLQYAAADVVHLFAMYEAWACMVTERAVVSASMERARQHLLRPDDTPWRIDFRPVRMHHRPFFLVSKRL